MRIFENNTDEKYISGINLWEISIKYALGKLELYGVTPDQIGPIALESGFHIADIHFPIFAGYYKLPQKSNHRDPFDRMLIWQSIQDGYVFISQDPKAAQYKEDGLRLILTR